MIERVEEYPIPFERDEIIKIQEESKEESYGLLSDDEIIKDVDEFHEKYIDEMIRTDEYSVFRCGWMSKWGWIYFWNHQLGRGFRVDDDWETLCPLVEMMDRFTEEYSSEDFEPSHYSWQLP